jgi:galactokinase/mevalonate kinase-like predicted kinase
MLAATLLCVLEARNEAPNLSTSQAKTEYAELVRDIERHEAKIMCGYQDAYMIVHGGLRRMDFSGKHPVNPGPHGTLNSLDSPIPFLLVTTGVERLSGAVHGPMSERWIAGEEAVVSGIDRIADLGRTGANALEKQNFDELAELMTENHEIVASLGGSGKAIDRLISACRDCGAMAAKLAGAGLGGTVIALTTDPLELQKRLTERGYSRFIRPSREPGVSLEL